MHASRCTLVQRLKLDSDIKALRGYRKRLKQSQEDLQILSDKIRDDRIEERLAIIQGLLEEPTRNATSEQLRERRQMKQRYEQEGERDVNEEGHFGRDVAEVEMAEQGQVEQSEAVHALKVEKEQLQSEKKLRERRHVKREHRRGDDVIVDEGRQSGNERATFENVERGEGGQFEAVHAPRLERRQPESEIHRIAEDHNGTGQPRPYAESPGLDASPASRLDRPRSQNWHLTGLQTTHGEFTSVGGNQDTYNGSIIETSTVNNTTHVRTVNIFNGRLYR